MASSDLLAPSIRQVEQTLAKQSHDHTPPHVGPSLVDASSPGLGNAR